MFYQKNGAIYKPNLKKLTVNTFASGLSGELDEGVRSIGVAEVSYNFDMSNGALKEGEGVSVLRYAGNQIAVEGNAFPKKIYFYKRYDAVNDRRDDKFLVYCSDGSMHYYNLYNNNGAYFNKITGLNFTTEPCVINYNYNGDDVILLSSATNGLKMLNGENVTSVDGAPSITSMCVHNERIFATSSGQGTSLWFSDDFNPTNWSISLTEAGFINMVDNRGDMLKVLSFSSYLYVFRSYGISRVTAYADQEDFSVLNLYTSQSKIYGKSVTMCGDYAIYLAEDGFYKFNGVSASRIMKRYDKFLKGVDNLNAEGVFTEGKLYMNVNILIDDEICNVILVYNVDDGSSYLIKGCNVISLGLAEGENRYAVCLCKDKKVLYNLEKTGSYEGVALKKVWRSATTDFDVPKVKKRLEKITFLTDYDVDLTIVADKRTTKKYKVKGGGVREVKVHLKGEVFSFEFSCQTEKARIVSPTVYVSYY